MPPTVWFFEPGLIVFLLLGGTIANRRRRCGQSRVRLGCPKDDQSISDLEDALSSEDEDSVYANDAAAPSSGFSTTSLRDRQSWRTRNVGIFGWERSIATPDTRQYRGYFSSRMLYLRRSILSSGPTREKRKTKNKKRKTAQPLKHQL